MGSKIWRASGEYLKNRKKFKFTKELLADKEAHARERVFSELGSRHRVTRKNIAIKEVKELKLEEVTNLELRKILGLEADFS